MTQWGIKLGARDVPSLPRSPMFFRFHAVFEENWPKVYVGAITLGLDRPPPHPPVWRILDPPLNVVELVFGCKKMIKLKPVNGVHRVASLQQFNHSTRSDEAVSTENQDVFLRTFVLRLHFIIFRFKLSEADKCDECTENCSV